MTEPKTAKPKKPQLILASASESRAKVLRAVGVKFLRRPTDLNEGEIKSQFSGTPRALALALAHAKARAASQRAPAAALVLAADQLLVCERRVFDKARNQAQAIANLRFLRGKRQSLLNGMVLWRAGEPLWEHASAAELKMRPFSDAVLGAFVRAERAHLTSVLGGARFEGPAPLLFETIDGDYWTLLGLPLLPLLAQLRRYGILAA